jgi:Tfp pilus assembly protein PilX
MKHETFKSHYQRSPKDRERGVAILTALFAILLLSAIAFGLMYMADTETSINSNFRDSQQAYYSARSGIQEVRERMRPASATGTDSLHVYLPTTVAKASAPATTTGVLYVLNGAAQPWSTTDAAWDREICHEYGVAAYNAGFTNPGTSVPCTSAQFPSTTYYTKTTSGGTPGNLGYTTLDYKWVRVTLKTNGSTNDSTNPVDTTGGVNNRNVDQTTTAANLPNLVCLDTSQNVGMNSYGTTTSGKEIVIPSGQTCAGYQPTYQATHPGAFLEPVYLLTSLAITPSGARRMLQAEVSKVDLPAPPGALTLPGAGGSYNPPSSNNFVIHGNDEVPSLAAPNNIPCSPYDGNKHAVVTTDAGTQTNVQNSLAGNPNRTDHYTGTGAYPDIGLTTTSSLGQLGDPVGLQNTVSVIAQNATQTLGTNGQVNGTYTDSQVSAFANSSAQSVTVVNGDLNISGNNSGTGILIVTGTLNWSGNGSWNGVVLVVGKGVFNFSGGGNGGFTGAVFVANIYSSIDPTTHVPVLSSALGAPTMGWNGGGGNGLRYDSCAIANAFNFVEYRELSVKELPY